MIPSPPLAPGGFPAPGAPFLLHPGSLAGFRFLPLSCVALNKALDLSDLQYLSGETGSHWPPGTVGQMKGAAGEGGLAQSQSSAGGPQKHSRALLGRGSGGGLCPAKLKGRPEASAIETRKMPMRHF